MGFPTFKEIFTDTSPGFIVLFVFASLSLVAGLALLILGNRIMIPYLKSKLKDDALLHRMIIMEANLPFILCLGAFITAFAPRLHALVNIFTSIYFVFALFGFARMIFNYFGSIGKTSDELLEKNTQMSYQAFPLTVCFFCLPKLQASKKHLKILKILV